MKTLLFSRNRHCEAEGRGNPAPRVRAAEFPLGLDCRVAMLLAMTLCLLLSACGDNFTPTPKVATYDPITEKLTLPAPCPDWSQSQTVNFLNETHSNFGCAVNTNSALQLDNPQDMNEGHGDNRPDTGITTGVLEQYRAGKLPLPMTPTQSSSSSQ